MATTQTRTGSSIPAPPAANSHSTDSPPSPSPSPSPSTQTSIPPPSSPRRHAVLTARQTKRAVRLAHRRTKFRLDSEGYPRWHNAAAGAVAGASARLLTAPLDLVRIRRQLSGGTAAAAATAPPPPPAAGAAASASGSGVGAGGGGGGGAGRNLLSSLAHIARTEGGPRSLFRGNVAATYLWVTYAAVQFSLYARASDVIRGFAPDPSAGRLRCEPPRWALNAPSPIRRAFRRVAESGDAGVAFVSGAAAGVGATLATYPFDICRTAFASRGLIKPPSAGAGGAAAGAAASSSASAAAAAGAGGGVPRTVSEFARDMYRTRGVRGFYSGCGPAVVQIVPYMGLNFAFYDHFVRMSDRHNVGNSGMAGAVAGGISKFLVYPMDTVKKRMQAQGFGGLTGREGAVRYDNMVDCVMKMARTEGVGAFYRGLAPTVVKSMAATGLTFAFYTMAKNTLETLHDRIYYGDMKQFR